MSEFLGDNPFRVRAYHQAARTLYDLDTPIEEIAEKGKEALMELPGVGPDLAEKILEFLRTGKVRKHEELSRKVPRGVLRVMEVPGVGPKTARLLYEGLGIDSLEKLKAALDRGTSPGSKASAPRGRRGSGKASPSPRRRESGGPWGRCSPWREASSRP